MRGAGEEQTGRAGELAVQLPAGREAVSDHKFAPPAGTHMRLLSKTLWIIAFVAATFCWMVLFEHGFSVQGFTKGVKEELGALVSLVNRSEKK